MEKTKYLIIGNSVAAVAAIESIREIDKDGNLTIVSDEPYHVYSRPLISYLLAGEITEDRMYYRPKDFYEKNSVTLMLNRKVIAIDTNKKEVRLEKKGSTDSTNKISYDKLLIATGGIPFAPKVIGTNLNGVFTFTTWNDATNIQKFISKNKVKNVVVVGGGLIGLKATEALMELGVKVTIVELADRILSATFDRKASELMMNCLRKSGCELITANTVEKVQGKNNKVGKVVLKDGKSIRCGMLIFAIGVVPNTELVKGTDIKINRGILVDKYMQTSVSDVYAAGDVVEAEDVLVGKPRPIAIWPNASIQGSIAGHNMSTTNKKDKEFYKGGFAMNSVAICGVPTISVGITDPQTDGYEIMELYDEGKTLYRKLVLKNNILVGSIFIGNIDRAGIYTGLINGKIDVSGFKQLLMNENFGLIFLPKDYRKHLVAGEVAI